MKSSSKSKDMVVCSKSYKDLAKSMIFRAFLEMRNFLQLFREKLIEMQRHGSCSKSCKVFAKSMIFRAFSRIEPLFATFC